MAFTCVLSSSNLDPQTSMGHGWLWAKFVFLKSHTVDKETAQTSLESGSRDVPGPEVCTHVCKMISQPIPLG